MVILFKSRATNCIGLNITKKQRSLDIYKAVVLVKRSIIYLVQFTAEVFISSRGTGSV